MKGSIFKGIHSGIVVIISLSFCTPVFSQKTILRGNVSDAVSKDGLPGAYITVNRTNYRRIADDKGNFEFAAIPPGEYDISIENVGYPTILKHVIVKSGETAKLFIAMTPEGKSLNEITVFGHADREKETGSRNMEKNAGNIINVISNQAMVRSPDINAANVLQRMSGITVQRSSGGDEAYAVIRGMQPRYNNTLVNGIKIASPDNKNRFVQLDIIPSDILSSIEISKSLTPDMEGDAIGGTVNMIVKDAPEVTSFKAITSIGYSKLFWSEQYVDFAKSQIQAKSPIQRNPIGYVAQPGDFSRSNLDFKSSQALPTGTLGFSWTQRFMQNRIGIVLADNVQNQYYGNISNRYTVAPVNIHTDTLGYLDVTNFKGYTQQLNNGLVAHVDYVFNERNKVNLDNFFIYTFQAQSRLSEDTTLLGTGRVGPGTGQIFDNNQSSTEHLYIENLKLSGKHFVLPNLALDWTGMMSLAGRKVPDLAAIETDYRIQANYSRTATYFDQVTRDWLRNDDKDYTGLLNLDYLKNLASSSSLELKAGGLYRTKTRSNNEDDYVLRPPTQNDTGGQASKPVWTNIYDVQWQVFNTAGTNVYNPNNYKADETVYAGYLSARYKNGKWEAGGGLRYENTSTDWSIKVRSPTQPSSGNQSYQDFLPSLYLKYDLTAKQVLHASYFKSISRPNYYEMTDGITNAIDYYIHGNPFLLHAIADNYDLRYEIFSKGEQHIFVGVFYKNIQNPIEQALTGISSGKLFLQPVNSPTAQNYGAEVSFTHYWGKFGITGNYTYTHSAVSSNKLSHDKAGNVDSVIETRPLQGQTDHIVNVSLLFKDVKNGIFAQLAYGYLGKTLQQISLYYQSDYYQRPMSTLAFSVEKDIHKHFTVFGKFNNLLNTPSVQYVQKTLEVSRDVYMASFSVGLRYTH